MHVRILRDTEYTPQPGDSPRCFGQLRARPGQGLYFPSGATPDLPDDAARSLIDAGSAEPLEMDVRFVPLADILDGIGGPA